jgi:hypothetical protein
MREGRTADLEPSLRKIVSTLRSARTPYMVIGAFALTAWGQPRATMDFDVMIAGDAIPKRLIQKLSQVGFEIDTDWAQHNPMIRHLQIRFRSGRIALDSCSHVTLTTVPRSRTAKSGASTATFSGFHLLKISSCKN